MVTLWVNGIVEEPKPEEKKDAKKAGEDQQAPPAKKDEPKDKAAKTDEKPQGAKKEEKKRRKPAKPKLKEPTAKLIFGKRDKDLLYVRREMGGTKADFAVPESLLPQADPRPARLSRPDAAVVHAGPGDEVDLHPRRRDLGGRKGNEGQGRRRPG